MNFHNPAYGIAAPVRMNGFNDDCVYVNDDCIYEEIPEVLEGNSTAQQSSGMAASSRHMENVEVRYSNVQQ